VDWLLFQNSAEPSRVYENLDEIRKILSGLGRSRNPMIDSLIYAVVDMTKEVRELQAEAVDQFLFFLHLLRCEYPEIPEFSLAQAYINVTCIGQYNAGMNFLKEVLAHRMQIDRGRLLVIQKIYDL